MRMEAPGAAQRHTAIGPNRWRPREMARRAAAGQRVG